MIGRVLNNRYKLLEKIGTGGMAIVYLAKDQLLGRQVAVKILQPQFADNEAAVKRFNREAQAVASVSHPNIVNIFDIGKDGDLQYIVMEYITAKDLKELLEEKGKLKINEAVRIAKEVCHALIKAHRNNIIHCDIKPHNILLSRDDRVKVTDFGIAQAVTAATMAQTESIVGSAHYLSPEQAKGSKLTIRSDIYSLGIVLYELVTGQVPFSGKNSVSVALKHIEDEPPVPQKFNSEIPEELQDIILKALAKNPTDRYNSVVELLRDLKEFEDKLEKEEVANQHTMVMSPDDYTKQFNQEAKNKLTTNDEHKKEQKKITTKDKAENNKKFFNKKLVVALITLMFFGVAILGIGYHLLVDYLHIEEVTVPNLVGKHMDVAKEKLEQKDLRLEVYYKQHSNEIEKNHIISQSPKPDDIVKKKRVISVVISKGAQLTTVPKLSGKSLREAKITIEQKDLKVGKIKYEYNDNVSQDKVISQMPKPKQEVKSDTELNLVVSKGRAPQQVSVPRVVGLSRQEAVQILQDNNLIVGQIQKRESLNYRQGTVMAQKPSAGEQIAEGTAIQLIVSKGIRNPYGAEVRTSTVRTYIQPGSEKEVKITVEDDNGQRVVYNRIHQPGDKVEKKVITVGSAIIRVYIDGQLNIEKRL